MTKVQPKAVGQSKITADPSWYKNAVICQLHVKSFYDHNEDGIGDFAGLVAKLDYISELGASAIWLMPFYPSPRRDDGYDVSAYRDVHPDYGTLGDFRTFLREAHSRGLRVIADLVINHTSDQHPWFQRAQRAKAGSRWRNFYVWSDTDQKYAGTPIIFRDIEKSNWTWNSVAGAYYWHRFYSHQPDLNFDEPLVIEEMLGVIRFWLQMGVDGLRLGAVPYLVEREGTANENLAETHDILRRIRAEIDREFPDRMLLAEVNQWPEGVRDYFGQGDECHMAFHFPLMERMLLSIAREDRFPLTDIIRQTPLIPDHCQWALFLRNHDELTLKTLSANEREFLWGSYAADLGPASIWTYAEDWRPQTGVVLIGDSLALASAFLFALANIAIAKAGSKRNVDSGVLLSIVLTVVLSALPFFQLSGPVLGAGANVLASLGWFAASGILATVWGRSTLFRAVQFAGVIRATTIRRLTPIFSIIFGWALLGESISTWVGLGMALMTLSFALLYADNRKQLIASEPAPGADLPRGYMFGIICALTYATSYVIRKRGLEIFPDPYFGALIGALAALFYYFLGALFSKRMSGVVRAVFVRPDAWQLLAALSISSGQVSQFISLSYIGVGRLAVINSCEVFLASYLAVFIFKTESWPSRLVMAATLVATAGIIFVAAG